MQNDSKIIKKKIRDSVKKYADNLKMQGIGYKYIYLFGSYAKNEATRDSDIDICVVTDRKRITESYKKKLWGVIDSVDARIQPYPITLDEFSKVSIMANEVQKYGVLIEEQSSSF